MFRILLLLCLSLPALASEERAREIIDKMEQLYRGDSSDATMTMQVQTPNYNRTLTMTSPVLTARITVFLELTPRKKDRGIATLKRDEEMWNYFPENQQGHQGPAVHDDGILDGQRLHQ